MSTTTVPEWATAKELGELIGISRYMVPAVAEKAGIRVRRIPGTRPRYNTSDGLRVRDQSVVPATRAGG